MDGSFLQTHPANIQLTGIRDYLRNLMKLESYSCLLQGAHYELTIISLFFEIYNVNFKGELRTLYLSFREKNNFYFLRLMQLSLVSDRFHRLHRNRQQDAAPFCACPFKVF